MIELLTNAEMADADRRTIAGGVPGIRLMERAGETIADAVRARFRAGSRVDVVAGPGNNGGDGFVAARLLTERGYPAKVLLVGARGTLRWLPRLGPVQLCRRSPQPLRARTSSSTRCSAPASIARSKVCDGR